MVVKHLRRRSLRQTPPAEVINPAPGLDPHPVTGQLHPPAKVDLLHVGEKILVETAQCPKYFGPAAESSAARPKNIAGIVILPFVPFDTLQNTTSAERIPQVVDETARSSGILEPRRLDERQQLGRYGSHGPIPIERFDERFDPSGRRFDIRIEQNEIVRIEILQRPVITSGEPVVTVQYDSPHSGKFAFEHAERIVRRTVVGHDDADPFGNRREHRRQETAQMPGTVPIQDHYFCFRSHSMRARSAGDLCFHRLCDHIHRPGYSRIFCSRRRT